MTAPSTEPVAAIVKRGDGEDAYTGLVYIGIAERDYRPLGFDVTPLVPQSVALHYKSELAKSHETIKRLNRRCQEYESALAEKIKNSGGSMGRSLANAAASRYKALAVELATAIRTCSLGHGENPPGLLCRLSTERPDIAQLLLVYAFNF